MHELFAVDAVAGNDHKVMYVKLVTDCDSCVPTWQLVDPSNVIWCGEYFCHQCRNDPNIDVDWDILCVSPTIATQLWWMPGSRELFVETH